MMLAGIVLTISFILTALTLSQVSALEKEAASQTVTPMLAEWRFLHERVASNLDTAIAADTSVAGLRSDVLPGVSATFRALASEKGYDFLVRLASGGDFEANGNEASLVDGANYDAWTYDGTVHFTYATALDGDQTDGVLWGPCLIDDGPVDCIRGVYVFMRLADGTSTMEESILYAVNQG